MLIWWMLFCCMLISFSCLFAVCFSAECLCAVCFSAECFFAECFIAVEPIKCNSPLKRPRIFFWFNNFLWLSFYMQQHSKLKLNDRLQLHSIKLYILHRWIKVPIVEIVSWKLDGPNHSCVWPYWGGHKLEIFMWTFILQNMVSFLQAFDNVKKNTKVAEFL